MYCSRICPKKKEQKIKELVSALKSWYLEFGQYCLDEQRWRRWSIWDHDHQMERRNATHSHERMHPQILIRSSFITLLDHKVSWRSNKRSSLYHFIVKSHTKDCTLVYTNHYKLIIYYTISWPYELSFTNFVCTA